MHRIKTLWSLLGALAMLTTVCSFAAHHEAKATPDINGLYTLIFELGAEQTPWSIAIEDQEGAVNTGVCVWTDEDGSKNQVRFTCENAAGNGFCWGSGTGLTGKYAGKVNRWSQRNQDGNVLAAGIWADAE